MRWLAVVLILAGCAAPSWREPVDNNPKVGIPDPNTGTPCVPPGMLPLADWRPVGAEPTILADAAGRLLLAIKAGYYVKSTPVYVWWIGGVLAVIDPNAEDQDVPTWYDAGLVQPDGKLKPGGGPTCDWKRGAGQTAQKGILGSAAALVK